ncbi:MAG: hypothetical protein ACYTFA_03845 [Planctomycetota bacterium]|jgi:hypothetical protein
MKDGVRVTGAVLVFATCAVAGGATGNDVCDSPEAIAGEGIFTFDNSGATTDGPPHDDCDFWAWGGDDIAQDVWYCWLSPCSGKVTVDLCGGTTADTRIAVYAGCACPQSDATPLACNDDACGFQSSATFTASALESYLIRIGANPLLGGAAGTFTIACGETAQPICEQPADNCQDRDHWNALASDGREYYVADDFTPAVDGTVDQICWWGTYHGGQCDCDDLAADAFEVTYFVDDGGIPGPWHVGPFSQEDGSLVVEGPVRTYDSLMDIDREYEYTAWHDPVEVVAGECYWIEITNTLTGTCAWFWEGSMSGNGLAVQDGRVDDLPNGYDLLDARNDDLAFCLNVPLDATTPCREVPINDTCEDRIPIFEGDTFFDTSAATTDILTRRPCNPIPVPDPLPCCEFPLGDSRVYQDIWYDYEPACSGRLSINLCGNYFDTKVAVYEDLTCSAYDALAWACSDDNCGDDLHLQSSVVHSVYEGTTYTIRVGGYGYASASDCFVEHESPGCDDRHCEWLVCPDDPGCCDSQWDSSCVSAASLLCRGRGGPGTISLGLTVPSQRRSLRDFAELMGCFTGDCAERFCDPSLYATACCEPYDMDQDGDVDLDDYHSYHQDWTGP